MSVQTFYLNTHNKDGLIEIINKKDSTKLWRFRVDEYDVKTRLQEELAHAMLSDIAKQALHLNQALDIDSWKRLTVDQFKKDSIQNDVSRVKEYWVSKQVKFMPSLDGSGIVTMGAQTSTFPKYVYAAWIEWLYAYCDNNGITLRESIKEWDLRELNEKA